jgi:class 3 adenylate cyclase
MMGRSAIATSPYQWNRGYYRPMGVTLPSGTVTFVFSDMAGSTALLKQLGDAEYATLLAVHRRLVREIFAAHEGQEIDTQGDAFFYSFVRARQAVAAAVEVTRAHAKGTWPGDVEVRIRLGLHTGEPAVGDEGYTGLDVVRASRIAATGAGGQVLLSDTTRSIVAGDLGDGVELRPLGERPLKDIDLPEPIFELVIDGVGASTAEPSTDAATPEPGRSEFARRTRELIESRVLSQLDKTFGEGFLTQSPRPPERSGRAMTKEIQRLKELHEDGALTDDQYQRAVDRVLEREPE